MRTYAADFVWLVRGRQRRLVFAKLKLEFMPNALRKEINQAIAKPISLRETSRHIRDFEERRLVQCINKTDPYNRIYHLTAKGRILQEKVLCSEL